MVRYSRFDKILTALLVESHESILALALKWNLFSTVETLASSSSSESHEVRVVFPYVIFHPNAIRRPFEYSYQLLDSLKLVYLRII